MGKTRYNIKHDERPTMKPFRWQNYCRNDEPPEYYEGPNDVEEGEPEECDYSDYYKER